jgi:hypothetical protein
MASVTTVLPIISNSHVGAIQGVRVTLVRPAMIHSAKTYSLSITPPLGLAYLAAMLVEAGHEVTAVDAMAEGKENRRVVDGFAIVGLSIDETVARIHPDSAVIGISCMFSQDWTWSRQLIRAVRRRFPHAVIVAGGEHITALAEYSLRDCRDLDVCVLGEGEETLTELVRAGSDRAAWHEVPGLAFLSDEQFVRTGSRSRIREVDDIPLPAWDLFPMSVYLDPWNSMGVYRGRTMGILGTRGCPYKCTFCSNLQMYGQTWVARDVDAVLDEIQRYIDAYGAENFEFYDLTMIIRKSWILEFCRKLDERGMNIVWQLPVGTRSETIDAEVAAALYRTGCRNIVYAPENQEAGPPRQAREFDRTGDRESSRGAREYDPRLPARNAPALVGFGAILVAASLAGRARPLRLRILPLSRHRLVPRAVRHQEDPRDRRQLLQLACRDAGRADGDQLLPQRQRA